MYSPAPLRAERHDRPDVLGRHHDARFHVRLFDVIDDRRGRHQRGILDQHQLAVGLEYAILDARHRRDETQVELALQPLLHDFHVQQAEESAAEPEPERRRRFGLVAQRCVVELKLFERVAQVFVLLRVGRVEPGEHERFYRLVARQCLSRAMLGVEHGIAGARFLYGAHTRHHVADFARREDIGRYLTQLVVADLLHFVHTVVRAERDFRPLLDRAVDDANARHGAAVPVVVGVVHERAQRGRPGRRSAPASSR